jgi:hypothetical protein
VVLSGCSIQIAKIPTGANGSSSETHDRPYLRRYEQQVGDPDHLNVFATLDAAETWFAENDPEGVAFEYDVLE